MRHRFLTVTVVIVLIGPISGQSPFRYLQQSPNSDGNGPPAPVNADNNASNSGSGILSSNARSNPGPYAASGSVSSQIGNQPPINNFQNANSVPNPVGSQLSSADIIIDSLENNPLIKQFLQGPTNTNPATNGAQLIQNSQNGLRIPYSSNQLPNANLVPGIGAASASFFPQMNNQPTINNLADYLYDSIENNPIIKQFLHGPTNANSAQSIQNSQNGSPISYASGSNPLPNVNPSYAVPASNAASASFFPQISNQPPNNNFQNANSFNNPVGPQISSADSMRNSYENAPYIKQFLQGSTNANPGASGVQFIQNPQSGFPNPSYNGFNPLPNVNDPANQRQVINRPSNPLPNANPSGYTLGLPEKKPFVQQFMDNPANQQFLSNRAPNVLPNANSYVHTLDSQEKNPLVKQLVNDPRNERFHKNRFHRPLTSRRRFRRPFLIHPDSLPKSNSGYSANNYNINKTKNSPGGNKSTNYPTISNFNFTEDSFKNPTPFEGPIFSTSITDNPPSPIPTVLSSTNSPPDYSLPSDVPLEYPKSDFPDGFFLDMLKSLGANSKSASTVAAIQPKRRSKCKVHPTRTGIKNSPKSPAPANTKSTNTGSATTSPSDNSSLFTLNKIGTVNQVSDSSQAGTKITTVFPSDLLKQYTLSSKKLKDSLQTSKVPKRKCRKRPKPKVIDSVSKTLYTSGTSSLATMPQKASTKSSTIINTKNINQNSDLTTARPSSAQPKKKKKCNKARVKPKAGSKISQNDLRKGQSNIFPSFIGKSSGGTLNLSNTTNNDTNFTSSGKRPKSRKWRHKKERKNAAKIKGLTAILTSGPSDTVAAGLNVVSTAGPTDSRSAGLISLSTAGPTDALSAGLTAVSTALPSGVTSAGLTAVSISGPSNAISAGLPAVPTVGPTDAILADNTKRDSTATDSSKTTTNADKITTTVSPDSCGDDEVWWDCKPLNNTCTNVARGRSQKNFICNPGCFCSDDLVQDVDGTCVDPDDCKSPVCKDEDHEENTDCLIECNRCEDDCHPCQMQSCVEGCDCKDGYKRNDNGTCVLDIHCPPCPTVISD